MCCLMCATIRRPFVLETLQKSASESSRPAKRHKPNPPLLSDSVSPRKQSRRSEFLGKGRNRPNTNTPDDDEEQDTSSNMQSLASNSSGSVECPVCGKIVPMTRINDHLDTKCKRYSTSSGGTNASSSKPGQKDAWSKLFDGKGNGKDRCVQQYSCTAVSNVGRSSLREKHEAEVEAWTPLPKASYTVLKDKQIRDLLAAHDLSITGDRSQLISRHERLALFAFPISRTSHCSLDGLRCTTQT